MPEQKWTVFYWIVGTTTLTKRTIPSMQGGRTQYLGAVLRISFAFGKTYHDELEQ